MLYFHDLPSLQQMLISVCPSSSVVVCRRLSPIFVVSSVYVLSSVRPVVVVLLLRSLSVRPVCPSSSVFCMSSSSLICKSKAACKLERTSNTSSHSAGIITVKRSAKSVTRNNCLLPRVCQKVWIIIDLHYHTYCGTHVDVHFCDVKKGRLDYVNLRGTQHLFC